jgi:hypothetical protein
MNLSGFYPGPVPVRYPGGSVVARPLRVRDLAAFDRWLARRAGHPLAVARRGATPDLRAAYLRRAYDLAREGAPGHDSAAGWRRLFGSPEGVELFLRRAVRGGESAGATELATLAAALDSDAWQMLLSVAFGGSPAEAVSRALDDFLGIVLPDGPPDADGRQTDWPKLVADFCRRYRMTPGQVGRLYVAQFRAMLGGEEEAGDRISGNQEADAEAQKRRGAFWEGENSGISA